MPRRLAHRADTERIDSAVDAARSPAEALGGRPDLRNGGSVSVWQAAVMGGLGDLTASTAVVSALAASRALLLAGGKSMLLCGVAAPIHTPPRTLPHARRQARRGAGSGPRRRKETVEVCPLGVCDAIIVRHDARAEQLLLDGRHPEEELPLEAPHRLGLFGCFVVMPAQVRDRVRDHLSQGLWRATRNARRRRGRRVQRPILREEKCVSGSRSVLPSPLTRCSRLERPGRRSGPLFLGTGS